MPPAEPDTVLTISQLTRGVKGLLGEAFGDVWVQGEVSRVVYHGSGHVYLTLKDEDAVLDAVIWRSTASRLRFRVETGDEILARGGIDVYPPRGHYQLIIRQVEPRGEGALRRAFVQLQKRLEAEGLFDPEHKQALPFLPTRIALVTSPTGAAIRDLERVIQGRLPGVELVLLPVRVQGDGAAEEIAAAIARADGRAGADVIVVGRGGGSLEDLWAFNEEVVARAIHAAATPIVSAVGHETDVTISDLAADVRAATPSHAGELVVPDRVELLRDLDQRAQRLHRGLRRRVDQAWQDLEAKGDRLRLLDPRRTLERRQEILRGLGERLHAAASLGLDRARVRIQGFDDRLRALSPLAVLGRGYALVRTGDGKVVRGRSDVEVGQPIQVRIADDSMIDATVDEVRPPQEEQA